MKQYHVWIDNARVIGIFAIVLGHVLPKSELRSYLYSFHVPLFFFLSGCVFYLKGESYRTFLKEKAKRLLVPYSSFALISICIYFVLGELVQIIPTTRNDIDNITTELIEMLLGYCDCNTPLWFLPSLYLCIAICFPLISIGTQIRSLKRKICYWCGIIVISFSWLLVDEVFIQCYHLPYKLELVLHMLSMFMLGYLFVNSGVLVKAEQLTGNRKAVLGTTLLFAGAYLSSINDTVAYTSEYYGNPIIYYVSALCSIFGISVSCMLFHGHSGIRYISKRTLAILVMHKFPVLFFQVIPFTRNSIVQAPLFAGCIIAVASIVMCLIAQKIISNMCPSVLGEDNRLGYRRSQRK